MDMTHGGMILAYELQEQGATITALDLYGTLTQEQEDDLIRSNIKIKYDVAASEYDLVVSPVHSTVLNPIADDKGNRIISHHEAVGILLKQKKVEAEIIEITGVRGKTSTAFILAEILANSGKKIVSSTSLGVFFEKRNDKKKIAYPSITPANALSVVRQRPKGMDTLIFETSLGFTGAASMNIFTSMENDYPIARGRLSAVEAKLYTTRYIDDNQLILDEDTYGHFGDGEMNLDRCASNFIGVERKNVLAAMTAALYDGVDLDCIKSTIENSNGVPGRMQLLDRGDKIIINNSNPAVDHISAGMAIEDVSRFVESRDMTVIMGGKPSACVNIDYSALKQITEKYKDMNFLLVGEIGRRLREMGARSKYSDRKTVLFALNTL